MIKVLKMHGLDGNSSAPVRLCHAVIQYPSGSWRCRRNDRRLFYYFEVIAFTRRDGGFTFFFCFGCHRGFDRRQRFGFDFE